MLRIYVISKFSEDADAAGPGKIKEPGVYVLFYRQFCIPAPAKKPGSVQGRILYFLKLKIIRYSKTVHIAELQTEKGLTWWVNLYL